MSITHPRADPQRRALVVQDAEVENGASIADAIARGLAEGGIDAISLEVAKAPAVDALQVDLLVVGVSACSLPRTRSRDRTSIREWLARSRATTARTPVAAVYDLQVRPVHRFSSAPTSEGHMLEELGFVLVRRAEHFAVVDLRGRLAEGETARAVAWGRQLSRACLSEGARSR